LNINCRDEIVPILRALSHLYEQPKLRDDILNAVAQNVNGESSDHRGRKGMDYWQILVLASVRLGCNLDYDKLQDLAEQHRALRRIMGLGDWDEQTTFNWRRIRDNICMIRPETIEKINRLICEEGHRLSPQAVKRVRGDTFVAETNIHYPTDSSLIRDGLRKVLQLAATVAAFLVLPGWRQHMKLYRGVKKQCRAIDRIASRKEQGRPGRLRSAYGELLRSAEEILDRAATVVQRSKGHSNTEVLGSSMELEEFIKLTRHACDTARRRVLEDESIPNKEKLFSVFETHTQLYKRGKSRDPMQFGRMILVFEDDEGFVVHYSVLPREALEADVIVDETRAMQKRLAGKVEELSLDRGFHTPSNQERLSEIIKHLCVPMKGSIKGPAQERKATVRFRASRQRHPGIESAIGALQSGNGLERCRDRTERGFKRYIGLGILGRNLHTLGKVLIRRENAECLAAESRRKRRPA
jgi:hypothetical protein